MSTTRHSTLFISSDRLNVLQSDALLPICTACGTQYPRTTDRCAICEDPRQYVPASGQSWTSLSELSFTRKHDLVRDEGDDRIGYIHTTPGFGINQTPMLVQTSNGSYIWDCAAFFSPHLAGTLLALDPPLKAIAISHPHFFTTSLTWSRVLRVPLFLCEDDKVWFQRLDDITPEDDVRWFTGETKLGPGVSVVQCGGHFPGSSILYWDRLDEPKPSSDDLPTKPTPVSGIIFTADTMMVQPTRLGFTFMWSVPNMIPLRPRDALKILKRVEHLSFSQATSTWPDRFIRENAKMVLKESITTHLLACGWQLDGDELVPAVVR